MFGVVLWSNPCINKAVIWCEDHGDLAYLSGPGKASGAHDTDHDTGSEVLDAGDYVQFDLSVEDDVRRARNAKIVRVASFSGLPSKLAPHSELSHSHSKPSEEQATAEVIAFHRAAASIRHRQSDNPQPHRSEA